MKVPTAESLKNFYQTIHNLITQKIDHVYFSEFKEDLQGQFSSDKSITESDYRLIKIMDGILPKIIGYPAFASLISDILEINKFTKINGPDYYKITFRAPSRKYLSAIFNKFGIKPLYSGKPESGVYDNYFTSHGVREGFVDVQPC